MLAASSLWRAHRSPAHDNELFFLNVLTGERTWKRPGGFLGMPLGEGESPAQVAELHERGPWVQYRDGRSRAYYYNPATKLKRWQPPASASTLVTEEHAFGQPHGERGPGHEQFVSASGMAYEAPDEESDGDDLEDDSDDEGDDDEEAQPKDARKLEDPPHLVRAFEAALLRKGVTHASQWERWAPRLSSDTDFVAIAPERRRARFESLVRGLVMQESTQSSDRIRGARSKLRKWWALHQFSSWRDALAAAEAEGSPCSAALGALEPFQREALARAVHEQMKAVR